MLEMSNRLARIDQQIHDATQMIDVEPNVSEKTKEALHQFRDKSEEAMAELNKNKSSVDLLVEKVFELEELADEAKDRVREDQKKHSLKEESFQAVIDAHNSVSSLKKELEGAMNPG